MGAGCGESSSLCIFQYFHISTICEGLCRSLSSHVAVVYPVCNRSRSSQGRGGFFSHSLFSEQHRLNISFADGGAHYLRTKITLPKARWNALLNSEKILDLKLLLDAETVNEHVRIQSRVGGSYVLNDQQARRWLLNDVGLLLIAILCIFIFM